jgi:hypothetical protein
MFNIEYDDMDDLFREAADKYHLDSGPAGDWEKIIRALHETRDVKPLASTDLKASGGNKKKYFWIFLIILITLTGWYAHYFWTDKIQNTTLRIGSAKQGNKFYGISDFNKKDHQLLNNGNDSENKILPNNKSNLKSDENNGTSPEKNLLKLFPGRYSGAYEKPFVDSETKMNYSVNRNTFLKGMKNFVNQNILSFEKQINTNVISEKNTSPLGPKMKDPGNDSTVNKKSLAKKHDSRFYAGVIISPGITFIKSQKREAGYALGLTGGYNISDHWSLETGFLFDKRNYYTKGEYFDKSKIQYLNNLEIISAEGSCNMFEIPVNVRFKFDSKNKKSRLSASIGTSTYLMKKESYNYTVLNYGVNDLESQTYYNSSNTLFAVLNFGLAYEKKVGKSVSLRIEPYFKTSIKGIGIGRLPMSSAGINLTAIMHLH